LLWFAVLLVLLGAIAGAAYWLAGPEALQSFMARLGVVR
jgi:hypothetical protein